MELSYWEKKTWLTNIDITIVGSGIVGLSCALQLSKKYPHAKILVLEKGILPQGASTKNAGFACFGSISEVLSDLKSHSSDEVFELMKLRWEGIKTLRTTLGDKAIAWQQLGGNELFLKSSKRLYDYCLSEMERINALLEPIYKSAPFQKQPNTFGFTGIHDHYITNVFEGQIDTGRMMKALLLENRKANVEILNAIEVLSYEEKSYGVKLSTNNFEFITEKLVITTNGFAKALLHEDVKPARAQVLITNPIKDLPFKGTFHLDEGFYYFRNIGNRVLLGGGRNLDFKKEETTEFGQTRRIQDALETLLKDVIVPRHTFEIDQRWSGIMGVGNQKKPIIKKVSERVSCGVRLGGMGIAIGSLVGKELSECV